MILRAYKYRIYPTPEQATMIDKTIGVCRLVYNLALEVRIRAHQGGKHISNFDIHREIKELRREHGWIAEVNSQSLYQSLNNLDLAYKAFFIGGGFPKFKSKRSGGSFNCSTNVRRIDWQKSTLTIPKIKDIPIVISRTFDGKIKRVTISRSTTGKYFASTLVEINQEVVNPAKPNNAVGVDLGITDFAVLSTGEKIPNPKHLQTELKRLKVLQRRASRKKKGSKNRRKANLRVAILHEKITNQRNDFLHKLSTKIISDNQTDTICVESLAVKNMVRNHKLAQAISDASWSEFVRQLEYKGKWYGKNVIKINRFYASSKICSNCGNVKDELNLSERTWDCSSCGATHDRDINAAINIRNSGMGNAGEPVELPTIVGAKKQEFLANSPSPTPVQEGLREDEKWKKNTFEDNDGH